MAKKESTEMTTTEQSSQELVTQNGGGKLVAPDYSKFGVDEDFLKQLDEANALNTDATEIIISRLAMLQPQSPEITENKSGYSAGMLIDNQTRKVYSVNEVPPWLLSKGIDADSLEKVNFVRFVPILKLPNEFIHWKNRNTEGRGMHWKTLDPRDRRVIEGSFPPRGRWNPTEHPGQASPPVTENINVLGTIIDEHGLMLNPHLIVTFARTNFKLGKNFVTSIGLHKMEKLPIFGVVYYFYTSFVKNEKGAFYKLNFAQGGLTPQNPELFKSCIDIARFLSDREHGQARQEAFISASPEIEEDDDVSGTAATGTSTGPTGDGEPKF